MTTVCKLQFQIFPLIKTFAERVFEKRSCSIFIHRKKIQDLILFSFNELCFSREGRRRFFFTNKSKIRYDHRKQHFIGEVL